MENREPEIWKPIPGYEGIYDVSSWGKIKALSKIRKNCYGTQSLNLEKIKNCYVVKRYFSCTLIKDGVPKTLRVHRIVYKVFVDKSDRDISDLEDINHIDFNKLNNYYKNLEEVSKRENQTHRYLQKTNSSVFPGVSYRSNGKRIKRWQASLTVDKKNIYLGTYLTEIEAYTAYLKGLNQYKIENKYVTKSQ